MAREYGTASLCNPFQTKLPGPLAHTVLTKAFDRQTRGFFFYCCSSWKSHILNALHGSDVQDVTSLCNTTTPPWLMFKREY